MLRPYRAGDLVQDTIGHYMRITAVLTPYVFKASILLTDHRGDPYDPGYAPITIGRSDIRGGYDKG